jgi:hydrogenase nickel incorporation protein HypB
MCDHCGCTSSRHPEHPRDPHRQKRVIEVKTHVLSENNRFAQSNRKFFRENGIFAINLVSSPGSGKTTLLEQTVKAMANRMPLAVIEGDLQTSRDAERIQATGVPAIQINTGSGCHLDAHMVQHALEELAPPKNAIVFIENVGNLVCPALFDLGEHLKAVIVSVTEGDDKPVKYPTMFHQARVCIINKIDLLPHVTFDVNACKSFARKINPELIFFEISALRGDGMDDWMKWLIGSNVRKNVYSHEKTA